MSRTLSRQIGSVLRLVCQFLLLAVATVVLFTITLKVYPKDADIHFQGVEKSAIARRVNVVRTRYSLLPQYVVRYRYDLQGKVYFGTGTYQMLVSPGDVLTIKYLPSDPKRSFVPGSANFLPVLFSVCATLLCFNAAILTTVRLKQALDAPPEPSCVILHSPVVPDDTHDVAPIIQPDIMPDRRHAHSHR